MEVTDKIKALAEAKLANPSHFLVDVVLSKHKPYKVTVIVDGDQGISIDDCSNLSRALSEELDKIDLIKENYTLEVGTPGLDQPLKLTRQFIKNVGRELRVKMKDKSFVQGKLIQADEYHLTLQFEVKEKGKKKEQVEKQIPVIEIDKAIVMVSFK